MVHEIWESESTCSKACDILRLCELLMSSISDHKFCQAPCSLVTTVACDNRIGRGLLSFGMQGFDRLVSRNQWNCRSFRCEPIADHVAGQFQLRQTKNVNTTNTFRPYSYRTWILEGFFNPSFFTRKIHTWKWITSSLCGTFYEVTKLEHLRMPNLNSKRLWNNYLPAKLTEKGSPFYQILGISIKEPAVPISINHFC